MSTDIDCIFQLKKKKADFKHDPSHRYFYTFVCNTLHATGISYMVSVNESLIIIFDATNLFSHFFTSVYINNFLSTLQINISPLYYNLTNNIYYFTDDILNGYSISPWR